MSVTMAMRASAQRTGRISVRALSTSTQEVSVERHTGNDLGILTLSLNRPHAKNALSRSLVHSMRGALSSIRSDSTVRALVLRSSVPRVFCAGADLKERALMTPSEVEQFLYDMKLMFRELEALPQPTIAALDGAALGGGLELSLCCDLRVAGQSALLGLPETSLAIIPGAGGTQRLARLVGPSRTKALVFTARKFGAAEALRMGVVTDMAEGAGEDAAYERAMEWAREILPNGPVAVRMAKRAIDHAGSVDLATGLDIEQLCYAQVIPTQDRLEGLRAFKEKRKPNYTGH
ncbi:hypothetical protein IW139_000920 [Coemansia sp. RSA 353]|nr:hypothetical protein GGH17_001275 [Coemansia sp. RSA 788]KAJ2166079.1 hypothetical protein GGH15_002973 [Coemansia sp. RSA 562]KAJ2173287.1 hypothetical protein GGH16_001921 [Coemansia sp. RSA 560]KAJ2191128.1 hypothetical protein EV181_000561 [Coemansia sp. RSA 532]KAJ2192424.1 hypothetical protein IW144_004889 [Coemansia sp. RSA 522]KAJ2203965.1 hypothetical protein IW145_003737 [Coemansia sp. RSA 521]KAJ2291773.1 hypothetical protein IW141_002416 [Coemansia sp. RSA 355]KAJ2300700.1 hyp